MKLPKLSALPKLSLPKPSLPKPALSKLSELPKPSLPKPPASLPTLPALSISPRIDTALAHGEAIANELRLAAHVRAKDYTYGLDTLRSIAQLAGSGATLWLAYQRKRAALPVSVATAAIVAGLSIAQPQKQQNPIDLVLDSLPNLFGILAVGSSAARAEFTSPLDLVPRNPAIPFTPVERARNVASLFATYTLVGHWAEMLFCELIRLGVVGGDYDRSNAMLWDWWLHPFPAEGLAGLFIALAGDPLRVKLLDVFSGRVLPALALSFVATQAVCTSIDYLTGMVANRNYELWDYREMPYNFQGQICLQNSLVYSTAATALTWLLYPARERWLQRLPPDVANVFFAAYAPVYAFLCLIYFT